MAATAKQKQGSWGGFLFVAFIAAIAYAPWLAGLVVVAGVLWLIFASNAKFRIGNNPALMQSGQRGHVDVAIATRSQVRSRSGNGPWMYTWTIVLEAQPPHSAGYRITTYRKIPEQADGPSVGQRYAAWFDKASPQTFHVDWNVYSAQAGSQARGSDGQTSYQPPPQAKVEESASVKRAQAYSQAHAKVARVDARASYLPADSNEPPPLVQADGGWDFDFAARGVDGRARIEDFVDNTEDGSTEMALTVMPRGGHAPYRTVVVTYVPYDRKFQIAKGHSVRVKVDPSNPGRLMIVS
jgi:hypothetical protein